MLADRHASDGLSGSRPRDHRLLYVMGKRSHVRCASQRRTGVGGSHRDRQLPRAAIDVVASAVQVDGQRETARLCTAGNDVLDQVVGERTRRVPPNRWP